MAKQNVASVKLTSAMAGHVTDAEGRVTGTYSYAAGAVVDRPADEAQRLIERGYAIPAETK